MKTHAGQSFGGVDCADALVESGQPGVVLEIQYGPTNFGFNQFQTLYVLLGGGEVLVQSRSAGCVGAADCFLPGADPGPDWSLWQPFGDPWEPSEDVARCAFGPYAGADYNLAWGSVSGCVRESFPACDDVTAALEDSGA